MNILTIKAAAKKFYEAVYLRVAKYRRGFVWMLSCAVAILVVVLYSFGVFDRLELLTLDWRFTMRGAEPRSSEIVFIDMAEDSIDVIGRWPWPRKWHAALIKILDEYQPKAVAFDVIFSEPQDAIDDLALEESLKRSHIVYMPLLYDIDQSRWRGFYRGDGVKTIYEPIPRFKSLLKGSGHINAVPDLDGILRRIPPVMQYDGKTTAHLGLKIGCDLLGVRDADIALDPVSHTLRIKLPDGGVRVIRLDKNNQLIVNWLGAWGKDFKHYSYIDVIKSYAQIREGKTPLIDLNEFRGKVCIIGLTAAGLFDIKPIPLANAYPAVGANAMVLNSILRDDFIRPVPQGIDIAIIIFISLVTTVYMCRLRFLGGMVFMIAGITSYVALSTALFVWLNIVIVTFYPAFGIFVSYVFTASYTQIIQSVERARLFKQATRDGLTHLYNIRHFSLLLEAEFKNAATFKFRPLSVIMGDVDNFKHVNDTYGHPAGDIILKDIAHIMESKCRQIDVVGRYGGEEFIIMLAGSHAKDAADVAEKIRAAVAERKFKLGTVMYSTTISIGVAEYTDEKTKDELVEKADKALYSAKKTGKNKVCIYSATGVVCQS